MNMTHSIEISFVHRDKHGNIKDQGTETKNLTEEQWLHLQQQASHFSRT